MPITPAAPSPTTALATATYAAGSVGTGVFSTVPTALLLYYCTEILKLPAVAALAIVFVPKAWAIVWDPLVGSWSDRTRSRWGRRLPFMLVGALGMAIGFVFLFSPPAIGDNRLLVAWVGAAYFLLATVYSIYAVPYIALPAEIAPHAPSRARMISWRMVAGMSGVFIGAAGAPWIVSAFGGGRSGYAAMSWIVAGVCLVPMLASAAVAPRTDLPFAGSQGKFWPGAVRALRAPGFARLLGAYYFQITGVGVVTAIMPYLVTHALGRPEGDIGTALAMLIGGAVVTPPFWGWMATRRGTPTALACAMLLFATSTCTSALAISLGASWHYVLATLGLAGFGFAGLQVIPFAQLADLALREANSTGEAREATFTGLWTAGEKLGLASGPGMVAAMLASLGDEDIVQMLGFAPLLLLAVAWILVPNRRGF